MNPSDYQNTRLRRALLLISFVAGLVGGCAALPTEPTASPPDHTQVFDPQFVEVMGWQGSDDLWFGNRNGVVRLNVKDGTTTVFEGVGCRYLLVLHHSDGIWCSVGHEAHRFSQGAWTDFDIIIGRAMVEAKDGTVWTGNQAGLARFNETEQPWEQVIETGRIAPHFIFSNGGGVDLAFQAQDQSFWFASFSEPYVGTTQWTPTAEQTWQPVGKWGVVLPMLETGDGAIWGGADESVIARWDGQAWQVWQPFRLKPAIATMLESQNGDIWVLAVADGVGRWDGQVWQIWSRDEAILQSCPGASAQNCFPADPGIEYKSAEGLGRPFSGQLRLTLTALLETQDGNIWVGTAREGISRWDGESWRNYTTADGLSSEAITTLSQSPEGVLWTGTQDSGVTYYDPATDRWHRFLD